MQKPETKIVNQIITWVKDNGGEVWKIHGSAMQRKGEPDLDGAIRLYDGQKLRTIFFKVEVKQPGHVPKERDLQTIRIERWASMGYMACFVTSLDEFKVALYDHFHSFQRRTDEQYYTGLIAYREIKDSYAL